MPKFREIFYIRNFSQAHFYEVYVNVCQNVFMLLIYPFLLLQDDVITAYEYDNSVAQGDLDLDAITKVSFYQLLIIISFNVSNL